MRDDIQDIQGPCQASGQEPSKGLSLFAVRCSTLVGVPYIHHVDLGSKACKARLLSSPGLPELTDDEIALARQQDRLDRGFHGSQCVAQCKSSCLSAPGAENTTSSEFLFGPAFAAQFSRSQSKFVARWGSFVSVAPLARASCPVCPSLCVSVICLCCFLLRHCRIPARPLVKTAPCFLMDSLCGWSVPEFLVDSLCGWSVPCFLMDSFGGWCFARLDLCSLLEPSRFPICLCCSIWSSLYVFSPSFCATVTRCWFARPHRQRALRKSRSSKSTVLSRCRFA